MKRLRKEPKDDSVVVDAKTLYVVDTDAEHLGGNVPYGDSWTFCPNVWRYVMDRFSTKSVLDVGSGTGHASAFFHRHGQRVVAVEGLQWNVDHSVYPAVLFDFQNGPVYAPVDLVHCHEVVEHIEEKFIENLLATLLNGRYILITAAGPDQPGHHHVNLQPETYWIDHLAAKGCKFLDDDSARIRKMAAAEGAWHMARSGMLFFNANRVETA